MEARGVRNCNPGNIRRGVSDWQGLAACQNDASFAVFREMRWGVRALIKTLLTYFRRWRLDTVAGIIGRWAPASDGNDTRAYIAVVCSIMGVGAYDRLEPTLGTLYGLARSICEVESGYRLTNDEFVEAWNLIGVSAGDIK